jgi:hypothetical protein
MIYRPMQTARLLAGGGFADTEAAAAAMLRLVAMLRESDDITDLELQTLALAAMQVIVPPFIEESELLGSVNDAFQSLRAGALQPMERAAA